MVPAPARLDDQPAISAGFSADLLPIPLVGSRVPAITPPPAYSDPIHGSRS